jgi:hypothetical protein
MKVTSTRPGFSVSIKRNTEHDWPSYSFTATADFGHGAFSASNHDMTWLNGAVFGEQLRALLDNQPHALASRQVAQARLEGSYGCSLSVARSGRVLTLAFCVGNTFAGFDAPSAYALGGSFEIDSEGLDRMLRDFEALLGLD